MFHPPTFHASSIFDDAELESEQSCLCGKTVKLKDCLACYTHKKGSNSYGYFAACSGQCIVAHVTEGSA